MMMVNESLENDGFDDYSIMSWGDGHWRGVFPLDSHEAVLDGHLFQAGRICDRYDTVDGSEIRLTTRWWRKP